MPRSNIKTRVLWAALAVLAGAGAMAAIGIAFEDNLPSSDKLIFTAITTVIYALVALLGVFVVSRRPRLGWLALSLLGLSYIPWVVTIWVEPSWPDTELYERAIALLSIPAGVSLHIGLLMIPAVRSLQWRILRTVAIGCSLLAGAILMALVVADDSYLYAGGGPILGALVLGALFGSAIVPIAAAIERSSADDERDIDAEARTPVNVTCPRCRKASTIPANTTGACSACGLRIRITLEEPRCACGYLLYHLAADLCPECGEPVPEQLRWTPPPNDAPAPPQGESQPQHASEAHE